VLAGRFVLARVTDPRAVVIDADLLALVLGPDGGAAMRRDDTADDAWAALWNGDDAHDPEATGMLSAIVGPLAAGELGGLDRGQLRRRPRPRPGRPAWRSRRPAAPRRSSNSEAEPTASKDDRARQERALSSFDVSSASRPTQNSPRRPPA
jgi:hypothetical protein